MAITVSVPTARWSGNPASGVNITSGSFTTTVGDLLVVAITSRDDGGTTNTSAASVTDSGGSLVWTQQVHLGNVDNSHNTYVTLFTAPVVSAQTITISTNVTQSSGTTRDQLAWVYAATGSAQTVGATGSGYNTTTPVDLAAYTSTATGSQGFLAYADYNGRSGTSSTDSTLNFTLINGQYIGCSGYLNANSGASGSAITFNVSDSGGAPAENWVAIEVMPSAASGGKQLLTMGVGD